MGNKKAKDAGPKASNTPNGATAVGDATHEKQAAAQKEHTSAPPKTSDQPSGTRTDKPTESASEAQAPSPYFVKDPEAFARNFARMVEQAGIAAANWVEPREKGDVKDPGITAFGDITKTLGSVADYWVSDPQRALTAQTQLFGRYMELWNYSIKRASGETADEPVKPEPGDRRFGHKAWQEDPFFSFLKDAYLLTSKWASDLVEQTEGLDEHTKHKAIFYTQQVLNSLSPTNFPATNPEVLQETISSDGENLVKGMKMLAEDIQRGGGELRLRQVDGSGFAVGRDMANTPGKVVSRNDICEVIQYEAKTDQVWKRPLLICPPWINKFYILDLNEKKSFIKWCVEQGHTVFVISWINPDERQAGKSFEHYAKEGILNTLDVIEDITGERQVNSIGYCVGGTLLSCTLAYMAEKGDQRIASATLFATQVDFTHAGDLKVFVDEDQVSMVEATMAEKGYLDGAKMATAFNMLRSRDLIWPYIVNNYMRGKDPMPFDLLYWNSDSTRMPAANHSYYLRNCYLENNLSQGKMVMDGVKLDLGKVDIPIYNLATKEDHIAPPESAYLGAQYFGGEVTYVLSGSGHIAGVVNPPANANGGGKYQYWTGPKPVGQFEHWFEKAEETPGSWWPHWQQWLEAQNHERVPARDVGSTNHKPMEAAPGTYVMVTV